MRGFIVIQVHYVITKYSKKYACEKRIKGVDFLNIFITDSLHKLIVYVKYYQGRLILNILDLT